MSKPATVTYKGRVYERVAGAGTPEELRAKSALLHELAQHLRPSIASSDVAQELAALTEALTNMARANNFLLNEAKVLPNNVPGNSERILALTTDAMKEVGNLRERMKKLAGRIGAWGLMVDKLIREKEDREDAPMKMVKQEESKQFSHLW
jgi:hypothetical protein